MASLTQIELLLPEFRAYAITICASPDDAEDLVQDAIERALRTDNRNSAGQCLPTFQDETLAGRKRASGELRLSM